MANLYVPVLEMSWAPRDSSVGHRTRDADDVVVVCRTRTAAAPALPALALVIGTRQLQRHPTKTRLVDVTREGFELLGFHVQQGRARRTGPLVPWMWPGQKAMKAVRRQIRADTARRGLRGAMAAMVAKRTPIIRGWRTDVRLGNSTTKFQGPDRDARQRLVMEVRARRQGRVAPDHLLALLRVRGLESCYAPGRCGTRP